MSSINRFSLSDDLLKLIKEAMLEELPAHYFVILQGLPGFSTPNFFQEFR
jgi:hypothetical protein